MRQALFSEEGARRAGDALRGEYGYWFSNQWSVIRSQDVFECSVTKVPVLYEPGAFYLGIFQLISKLRGLSANM